MLKPKSRINVQDGPMKQLDGKTGRVQKLYSGTERIFSRVDTKQMQLICKNIKDKEGRVALGEYVYNAWKQQEARGPEYTEE